MQTVTRKKAARFASPRLRTGVYPRSDWLSPQINCDNSVVKPFPLA